MQPDNAMYYFGQHGLTPEHIRAVKALLRSGMTIEGIEQLLNIPYSIVVAIRFGKFFK
jgi:hypothetical protein